MRIRILFSNLILIFLSYILRIYVEAIFIATFGGFGDPQMTVNSRCNVLIYLIFFLLIIAILAVFISSIVCAAKQKYRYLTLIAILCLVFSCILGLMVLPDILYIPTNKLESDLASMFRQLGWVTSTQIDVIS